MDTLKRVLGGGYNQAGVAPVNRKHQIRLLKSYAPDWIITIVLAAAFFAIDEAEGYRRVFSLTDTSLRHPYAVHERIPNKALWAIAIIAPFVLQIAINLITIRSWWDFHNATLGLLLGLALTGSVTQFTKITVGRPRPDIISRCIPREGSVDPLWGLSNSSICTQTNKHILRDGFRSFPSGHSSLSFAGLGFLAFYLAGKLHLFDKRGHAGKAWLALAPLSAAALVAISRSMDYRHHWHDILVGSVLGLVFAYFSYRQYFPPLTSKLAHRPYSPRIQKEESREGGSQLTDNASYLPTHIRTNSVGEAIDPTGSRFKDDTSRTRQTRSESDNVQESLDVPGTIRRPSLSGSS